MKREPERDYAHRTLEEKLGLRPNDAVALVGAHHADFKKLLTEHLAKGPSLELRTQYDKIFLHITDPGDLDRIAQAARHLKPGGALWIFHPKGRGANPPDSAVRAAGLAAGLVDNKISAYTDTHTATRYVIPVGKR